MSRIAAWRPILLIVIIAAGVAAFRFLPVSAWIQALLATIASLGPLGPVLLAAAFVAASVLVIPGSLLTLGAGFLFGVITGTVAVSIGSTLGAAAAFLVGRLLARRWVEERVAQNVRFRAIDDAVRLAGFKIVLLTRLSPVFPFNLLNYAYGVTKVKFHHYFFASWLGMLPGTLMYVYLGRAAKNFTDLAAGNTRPGSEQMIFFIAGLLVTVVATVYVARISRRALNNAIGVRPDLSETEA